MKIYKGLEKEWNVAIVNNSTDFYSKAMLEYLEKLADLLEEENKLTATKLLNAIDKANDLKYTYSQQHKAVELMLQYWFRKEELQMLVDGFNQIFGTPSIQPIAPAEPLALPNNKKNGK